MNKKTYMSPEVKVMTIGLHALMAGSGVNEDGTEVDFGNTSGDIGGAASRHGSIWDDEE